MSRPVFLFAFAYNPATALPEVVQELKVIDQLFADTEGEVKVIWQATQADLETHFDLLRNDLRLFHFSGHAGPHAIQLNRDYHTAALSFAEGLSRLIGMAPGLRLVFLNGCSTEGQVQTFLDQGIPAVIATTKPLLDQYAVDFARRFYQNFTRRNSKMTLQQAFDAAFYSFIGEQGSFNQDMLYEQMRSIGSDDDSNEALYELHFHPAKKSVGQERFTDWLVQIVEKDHTALKKEVRELVGKARLEEALLKLAAVLPEAVQVKAQFSAARHEKMMGMLDSDEWFKVNAKITNATLELLKLL